MSRFQHWNPWLLRNCLGSRRSTAMAIAVAADAAATKTTSSASQHVEIAKALHARTVFTMMRSTKSVEMTKTQTPAVSHREFSLVIKILMCFTLVYTHIPVLLIVRLTV